MRRAEMVGELATIATRLLKVSGANPVVRMVHHERALVLFEIGKASANLADEAHQDGSLGITERQGAYDVILALCLAKAQEIPQ